MDKHINAQDLKTIAPTLRMGEKILLSGVIYTARDQAHLCMMQALDAGELLPFAIDGAAI